MLSAPNVNDRGYALTVELMDRTLTSRIAARLEKRREYMQQHHCWCCKRHKKNKRTNGNLMKRTVHIACNCLVNRGITTIILDLN